MKKATIIALILVGVIALGSGTTYAVGQIAKSNAITEETALNFAYVDAGVSPEEAEVISVEFDWEKGKFVYEIEFLSNGTKYEYTVDSSSGRILEKETETIPGASEKKDDPVETSEPAAESEASQKQVIGMDKAKSIALKDAGAVGKNVTFTKAKKETEHGQLIYDIEFYIADEAEYEYEIDAFTGAILESGFEEWVRKQDEISQEEERQEEKTAETATSTQKESTSQNEGSSRADAPEKETSQNEASEPKNTTPQQISIEKAKNIALGRAGVSAGSVTYSKAKLEMDDGRLIYDIEFYVAGVASYEYEIDTYTGAILDEDREAWTSQGGQNDDDDDDYDDQDVDDEEEDD